MSPIDPPLLLHCCCGPCATACVERLLAQCTPAEYERRLPAVLDNYHRVLKYLNPDDRLYEEFFA